MVKPSKAFVPQAEDISAFSSREIFQVGSLFASLLSKRETDRILKFGLQSTVGRIPIKTYFLRENSNVSSIFKKYCILVRKFIFQCELFQKYFCLL